MVHVWVNETRPWLQGARLTAWELGRLDIPYTVIADVAAASVLAAGRGGRCGRGRRRPRRRQRRRGQQDRHLPARGAGPATRRALLRRRPHRARSSFSVPTSSASIPVEERDAVEVLRFGSTRTAPRQARAANRAFDVTPASLVRAIVTDLGIRAPAVSTVAPAGLAACCSPRWATDHPRGRDIRPAYASRYSPPADRR